MKEKDIESLSLVWEFWMVKSFGLGFYDLDERTVEGFALIERIIQLHNEVKS